MTKKIKLYKKRAKKVQKRKKKIVFFFVYVDYTTKEKVSRPFYVGKGKESRVKDIKTRTVLWFRITNKYGQRREVVLKTKSEKRAFRLERKLIKQYKTFAADWPKGIGWGANLTRGGEGKSGIKQSKALIRKRFLKIRGKNHPMYGKKHTEEARRLMSICNTGEENSRVLLKATDVPVIRHKWTTTNYSIDQLAEEYGVSNGCITQIVYNYTWKIPEEEHLELQAIRKINTDIQAAKIVERNELVRQEYAITRSSPKVGKKFGINADTVMAIVKNKS